MKLTLCKNIEQMSCFVVSLKGHYRETLREANLAAETSAITNSPGTSLLYCPLPWRLQFDRSEMVEVCILGDVSAH